MLAAVVVLLVGCYVPPITDAVWRRTVGTLSGIGLALLALAWGRGWPKRPGSTVEDARAEGQLAAAGVFMGAVCGVAWAAGLVG